MRIRLIAHRGLHDLEHGIVENTATAFRAAIAGGYGIETDIQAAADGEPVIFHDESLERLTGIEGEVAAFTPEQLRRITLRHTDDRILTLTEFLRLVDGRAPLYLEIKSVGGADQGLDRRIAEALASYRGPASVISFDPASLAEMRRFAPHVPRGLSAMRFMKGDAPGLSTLARFRLTHMLDIEDVKPDFLTYEVNGLAVMGRILPPPFSASAYRRVDGAHEEDRRKARLFADAMIFEGFGPSPDEMAAAAG